MNFILSSFQPKSLLSTDVIYYSNTDDPDSSCVSKVVEMSPLSTEININKSPNGNKITMGGPVNLSGISKETICNKSIVDMELTKVVSCHKGDDPCGKIYIKCVMLNVSGLNKKLNDGILDQYLANFDILLVETNWESSNLQNTLLSDFTSISKKKVKLDREYKYGGIHGICALLSPGLKDAVDLIPDTKSECVLYMAQN